MKAAVKRLLRGGEPKGHREEKFRHNSETQRDVAVSERPYAK